MSDRLRAVEKFCSVENKNKNYFSRELILDFGSDRRLALPFPVGVESKISFHEDSYLVDPASSHMLVSKIKPCMSKYKPH